MPGTVIGVHTTNAPVAPYAASLAAIAAAVAGDIGSLDTIGYSVVPAWLAGVQLSASDAQTEANILNAVQATLQPITGYESLVPSGLRLIAQSISSIAGAASAAPSQVDAASAAVMSAAQQVQSMLANLPSAVQGTPDDPQSIDSLVSTAQTDLKPIVTDLITQAQALSAISQQMMGSTPILGQAPIVSGSGAPVIGQPKQVPTSMSILAVVGSVVAIAGIGYGIYWVNHHKPASRTA